MVVLDGNDFDLNLFFLLGVVPFRREEQFGTLAEEESVGVEGFDEVESGENEEKN